MTLQPFDVSAEATPIAIEISMQRPLMCSLRNLEKRKVSEFVSYSNSCDPYGRWPAENAKQVGFMNTIRAFLELKNTK